MNVGENIPWNPRSNDEKIKCGRNILPLSKCFEDILPHPIYLFLLEISLKEPECGKDYACKGDPSSIYYDWNLKGIQMCNTREITE